MKFLHGNSAKSPRGPGFSTRDWVVFWLMPVVGWVLVALVSWETRKVFGWLEPNNRLNMTTSGSMFAFCFGFTIFAYSYEETGKTKKGWVFLALSFLCGLALGILFDFAFSAITTLNAELKILTIGAGTGGLLGLVLVTLKYLAHQPWNWPSLGPDCTRGDHEADDQKTSHE